MAAEILNPDGLLALALGVIQRAALDYQTYHDLHNADGSPCPSASDFLEAAGLVTRVDAIRAAATTGLGGASPERRTSGGGRQR